MLKLEQLISEWRKTMASGQRLGKDRLDELETHLRETVDQLVRTGMSEADAFETALAQLGSSPALSSEFKKLDQRTWLPLKVVIGIELAVALGMAPLLASRIINKGSGLLLATHVFTVTIGYVTVFLIGALGICYVCQRCFSDFSLSRQRSISRLTFPLGVLALCVTAIGTGLGMLWAKGAWDRYWAWDVKETGAACVLGWLFLFTAAHLWQQITTRGLLLLSIVGNIVVSLAWFGANLLADVHSYTTPHSLMLILNVGANLVFFLVGLAPAGFLRLSKA
jgi:hypothetical protein